MVSKLISYIGGLIGYAIMIICGIICMLIALIILGGTTWLALLIWKAFFTLLSL